MSRETSADRLEENIDQPPYEKEANGYLWTARNFQESLLEIYKERRLFTTLMEVSPSRSDEISFLWVTILGKKLMDIICRLTGILRDHCQTFTRKGVFSPL